jgi:putative peptidoglycan lipid II flippase
MVRVALTLGLGYLFAIPLPVQLGIEPRWGAAGISLASGLAAGIEFHLLRRGLLSRLGSTRIPVSFIARLWGSAFGAAAAGWVVKLALEAQHPLVVALFSLGMYGAAYFAISAALGVPHAWRILGRVGWRRGS